MHNMVISIMSQPLAEEELKAAIVYCIRPRYNIRYDTRLLYIIIYC